MAPSAPVAAFILAAGVGGRSGHSFQLRSPCGSRWAWGVASPPAYLAASPRRRPRPAATAMLAAAQPQEDAATGGDGNHSESFQYVLGQRASGAEGPGADAEAEALRQKVFANEKGFKESSAFNPVRAREAREEEEARALASQWGSTPDRAKEIMRKTQADKELDFQELERIAEGLNMTDEQQRAFMLKASMKKLSSSTTLPKRAPRDRVKEAVDERVFGSEKGFMKNSAAFKNRMKVGSGVRFDSRGFPATGEDDPVIQAAKERTKEERKIEGVTFPSLPDCPRCSTPTIEDELSQFGMCSQCKAQEISSKAYNGPQAPSKYTYDNGDAPFSGSWLSPMPVAKKGNDAGATGGTTTRKSGGKTPSGPTTPFTATASSSPAPSSRKRKTRESPSPAPIDDARGLATAPPFPSSSIGHDGRGDPGTGARAPLQQDKSRIGKDPSSGRGGIQLGGSSAPVPAPKAAGGFTEPPLNTSTARTVAKRARAPNRVGTTAGEVSHSAGADPTAGKSPREAVATSKMGGGDSSDAREGLRDRGTFSPVPASITGGASASGSGDTTLVPSKPGGGRTNASRTKSKIEARIAAAEQARSNSGGREGGDVGAIDARSAASAEVAIRKLSLEVSELRTLLAINRAALARVETLGGRPATAPGGMVRTAGGGESSNSGEGDTWRDSTIRKLTKDVAELRKELSEVLDKVGDTAVTPPRGRGGDTEVVQNLNLQVAELRLQLESARKETALTRSALRRLQEDIDGLRKSVARR
ncbi:unnamed protein product [Scytosiphon promiscuus]